MPQLLAAAIVGRAAGGAGRPPRAALRLGRRCSPLGAVAGLGDFWKWGYEYGHQLDPHAAIKVPGMSYQPPLIGSKQLLNFHATSWPDIGGWIAIAALACVLAVAVLEWRRARPPPRGARRLAGGRPPRPTTPAGAGSDG